MVKMTWIIPLLIYERKISKDIEGGIPGYWQGQVLIPFIKDPVTKERKQIHPEDIHLTAKDFEASKDNISKDEWKTSMH